MKTVTFKYKQVIVIRADLNMSVGKIAAQASHAAILSAEKARRIKPEWWSSWFTEGQRKIVLKVNSEDALLSVKGKAEALGLPIGLVTDMGLTELKPGTLTALGIGPAPSNLIDRVTGNLPLL